MTDAKNTPKIMYLKAGLATTLTILVLWLATNFRCLGEGATPQYGCLNCLSVSLILMVSLAFVVLNAVERRNAAPDDRRRLHACSLAATLLYNTFALTQVAFSEDSTLLIVLSMGALITLFGTVYVIITLSSDDDEISDSTKLMENNEYVLIADEEMQ